MANGVMATNEKIFENEKSTNSYPENYIVFFNNS